MIDIGALEISAMRIGSTDASQAYVGDTLVWSAIQPVTTGLCCEYQVSTTGVTTIGNAITSGTQTMNVDGVDYPASTTFNFDRAGKHYVSWGDITNLPINAFANVTALTKVNFQDTTSFIGAYAFSGCTRLQHADMSHTAIWAMNAGAFSACTSLQEISLSPRITKINARMFDGCSGTTAITIPSSVTQINEYAFQNTSSSIDVVIPGSVKSISFYSFAGLSGYYYLNEGLESIGNSAFEFSTNQFEVTIPSTVTSIGYNAFESTQTIRFKSSTPPTFGGQLVADEYDVQTVYVPSGSLAAYQAALPEYASRMVEY